MRKRLGFITGVGLAILGVSGMAGGGILWNFQGRTLGLGTTITSLVLIGISLVLLRPLQQEPTVSISESGAAINLQAPRASITGVLLAVFGSFGLAASGILWNFKGQVFGLAGTIASLLALGLSLIFLRPLTIQTSSVKESTPPELPSEAQSPEAPVSDIEGQAESETELVTADQLARSLAESQLAMEPLILSNFATDHLLAGQTLPVKRRRAGSSMKRYKDMAGELFKS